MNNVLLADDHKIVRKGLKAIIEKHSDFIVAGEASNGQEALNMCFETEYDIIVLDISMPGRDGLDILAELRKTFKNIRVLMLSMYPEEQFAVRAFKAGASGYLNKDSAPDELIDALIKISQGGKYISLAIAEKLAFDMDRFSDKAPHESLSDREFQVLCLIAQGMTVTDIGGKLSLSVKTISTYRANILEKMRMKTNAELTLYAVKSNLVT
ncbi:MAG: response regulator transcription factor [bacterium]|nr:response regulator transcription factor [bacterium]